MIRRALRGSLWLAVVGLLLCWTFPAFADNPTQFAITSVNNNLWGEYTSPYGTNNVGGVICDDIKDTVYLNTTHTYNAFSANSLIASGGGIWGPNQNLYAAAAYLVLQVYSTTGTAQEYASWALWSLFDPTDALNDMNGHNADQTGCNTIFGANAWNGSHCTAGAHNGGLIATALANGFSAFQQGAFNNLVVYVPKNAGLSGWCTTPGSCDSQEFWGQRVPDGGSALLYLVIAGAACFGTMFRNRSENRKPRLA